MNKEKKLYDYLKDKKVNIIVTDRKELSQNLNVSEYSIDKYKKSLADNGYILCKLKWVDGKMKMIFKVTEKEINNEEQYESLFE